MSDILYLAHHGLREAPFSIAPNPRFLYLSDRHREGLAHLVYGLGAEGGFVLLTGEVGTGKTTLCRALLEQVPEDTDVAFIINPRLSPRELLETLIDELGFEPAPGGSIKAATDSINRGLLQRNAAGRNTIVIIDEAQNLTAEVLEQLRLLTNLETHQRKLLRFILLGQPELRELLASPALRQINQRITARYHLGALPERDTSAYIAHRMRVAGGDPHAFRRGACRLIHRLSGGLPRLINVLADRALLGAYAENTRTVTPRIVRKAAREVLDRPPALASERFVWASLTVVSAAAIAVSAWWFAAPEATDVPQTDIARAPGEAPPAEAPAPSVPPTPRTESAPATSEAPPPRESTGPLPWRPPMGIDFDTALTALFGAWNLTIVSPSCDAAPDLGLACLHMRGNWLTLRTLNRPALLTLRIGEETSHVVLTGMGLRDVELISSGGRERRPRADLDPYWTGEFVALWRAPSTQQLMLGSQGNAVGELRSRLTELGYRIPTGTPDRFDQATAAAVRAFQTDEGLTADGIAGAFTLVRMADRLGSDAPRLEG